MARPFLISSFIDGAKRRWVSGNRAPRIAWIMLLLVLAMTMCFAGMAKIHEHNQRANTLAAQRQQLDAAIKDRLDHDAQILRAAAAMLMLQRTMGRTDWLQFHKNLIAQGLLDGLLELGYAPQILTAQKATFLASLRENSVTDNQITPARDHPVQAPILFIAPEKSSGQRIDAASFRGIGSVGIGSVGIGSVGFDLLSVPEISTLLAQATDSGAVSFGPLVTDRGPSRCLMVLPVFSTIGAAPEVSLRRQQIIGFVFAVLRTDTVLHGVEAAQYRHLQLIAAPDLQQKYDGSIDARRSISPEQNTLMDIDLYGTHWRVALFLTPMLEQKIDIASCIAVVGVFLGLLFFAIFRRLDSLHHVDRSRGDAAQSNIRQLQHQLSVITAHTDHAVMVVNRRHRIMAFNPAAEILFGASAAQVVGTDLSRFLPNGLSGAKRCLDSTGGGKHATEYRLHNDVDALGCRANGEQFPFNATIVKCRQWGHRGYLILLKELTNTSLNLIPPAKIGIRDAVTNVDRQKTELHLVDIRQTVICTDAPATTHTAATSFVMPSPASNPERRKQVPGNEHATGRLYRQLQSRMMTMESALEEQKKRLAREMHDDFGQLLSAMKMDLVAMQMQLAAADNRLLAQLGDVSELVDTMIVSVRRIIANLPPQHIEEHGLASALKQLTNAHSRRHKVACRLQISSQLRALDAVIVTPVYRIVQEALNNIAKHARATEIDVSVEQNDDCLHLRVTDNGDGISTYELQKPGGFGLVGMRERIILMNGEMLLETASGIGTTISATIPLGDVLAV